MAPKVLLQVKPKEYTLAFADTLWLQSDLSGIFLQLFIGRSTNLPEFPHMPGNRFPTLDKAFVVASSAYCNTSGRTVSIGSGLDTSGLSSECELKSLLSYPYGGSGTAAVMAAAQHNRCNQPALWVARWACC